MLGGQERRERVRGVELRFRTRPGVFSARGLDDGTRLLVGLLVAAKSHGVRWLVGTTLSENRGMLALARKLGFGLAADPSSATITRLTVDLAAWPPGGASGPAG